MTACVMSSFFVFINCFVQMNFVVEVFVYICINNGETRRSNSPQFSRLLSLIVQNFES